MTTTSSAMANGDTSSSSCSCSIAIVSLLSPTLIFISAVDAVFCCFDCSSSSKSPSSSFSILFILFFFSTAAFNCPHPASISIPRLTRGVHATPYLFSKISQNAFTRDLPDGDPPYPPVGFNGITLMCTISGRNHFFTNLPNLCAVSGVSFSCSISAHSNVMRFPVVLPYSCKVSIKRSNPPYRTLAGNRELRSSSLAQCKLTAKRTWGKSMASLAMLGTMPTVDMVILR
mmetsp:Transcript_63276/g.95474  ORF Transcript_63276/g.95474 Transcript_63276/m.95474 type:complete len:230 (+) Transcript_63276:172-861(+)